MLKISHLEQLTNEIFALISTRFSSLKLDHLVKRIGITVFIENLNKKNAYSLTSTRFYEGVINLHFVAAIRFFHDVNVSINKCIFLILFQTGVFKRDGYWITFYLFFYFGG